MPWLSPYTRPSPGPPLQGCLRIHLRWGPPFAGWAVDELRLTSGTTAVLRCSAGVGDARVGFTTVYRREPVQGQEQTGQQQAAQ